VVAGGGGGVSIPGGGNSTITESALGSRFQVSGCCELCAVCVWL
jgi:hypothetical protein